MFKEVFLNLKEHLIDKDMADPVFLNFCIFTVTYALSFLSCLLPWFLGVIEGSFFSWFIGAFIECVMPTTATLILGSAFQNLSIISQNAITHFSKTVWLLGSDIVYMVFYPVAILHLGTPWVDAIIVIITFFLLVLCLSSISDVEQERQKPYAKGNHERSVIRK